MWEPQALQSWKQHTFRQESLQLAYVLKMILFRHTKRVGSSRSLQRAGTVSFKFLMWLINSLNIWMLAGGIKGWSGWGGSGLGSRKAAAVFNYWLEGREIEKLQNQRMLPLLNPTRVCLFHPPAPEHLGKVTLHQKQTKERNFLGGGKIGIQMTLPIVPNKGTRSQNFHCKSGVQDSSKLELFVGLLCKHMYLPPFLWAPRAGFHTEQWQCEGLCLNLL